MRKDYPLFKVHLDATVASSLLSETFASGFLNEGTEVAALEAALRPALGAEHLTVMNSCTSALTVALRLAGARPGTTVVTTPMTCVATNAPILHLGADIRWADIDPETGMPTPESLSDAFDATTVAALFVDWAGSPPHLKDIDAVCRAAGVRTIQDAAHAFMAEFDGAPVARFTDFTCFSFQAIKHFTCGDGGALVCRDQRDHLLARKLKWFGYDRDIAKDAQGNWKTQQAGVDIPAGEIGYKFNLNNIAAAIGLANLPHMARIVVRHRRNAALYDAAFSDCDVLRPLRRPPGATPSFWVYSVLLAADVDRDALTDLLAADGIHAGSVHVPNDGYACFAAARRPLPGVRAFEARQLSFPCGWWLDDDDVRFIADRVRTYLR